MQVVCQRVGKGGEGGEAMGDTCGERKVLETFTKGSTMSVTMGILTPSAGQTV